MPTDAVTVGTDVIVLAEAMHKRKVLMLQNTHAANTIYFSDAREPGGWIVLEAGEIVVLHAYEGDYPEKAYYGYASGAGTTLTVYESIDPTMRDLPSLPRPRGRPDIIITGSAQPRGGAHGLGGQGGQVAIS